MIRCNLWVCALVCMALSAPMVVMATETELVAETEPVVDTETVVESELVAETEPIVETEPVAGTGPVVETETVAETGMVVETETETEPEPETETALLDDDTVDLLKQYLQDSVSGNTAVTPTYPAIPEGELAFMEMVQVYLAGAADSDKAMVVYLICIAFMVSLVSGFVLSGLFFGRWR